MVNMAEKTITYSDVTDSENKQVLCEIKHEKINQGQWVFAVKLVDLNQKF